MTARCRFERLSQTHAPASTMRDKRPRGGLGARHSDSALPRSLQGLTASLHDVARSLAEELGHTFFVFRQASRQLSRLVIKNPAKVQSRRKRQAGNQGPTQAQVVLGRR